MDAVLRPEQLLKDHALDALFKALHQLYSEMDAAYAEVAHQYGFHCSGCEDNCCLTRFHHHTIAEYLFIYKGFQTLESHERQRIKQDASNAMNRIAAAERKGEPPRVMCPLNDQGRCLTYEFRPMICRLHGIAHELHRPGMPVIHHPGCEEFHRIVGNKTYIPFDRTPFYVKMAQLEKQFRQHIPDLLRIKLTVAEMIAQF